MKRLACLVLGAGLVVTAHGQGNVLMNSVNTSAYVRFSNSVANAGINTGWVSNTVGAVQGSLGYVNAALYWADPSTPTAWHIVSPLATFGTNTAAGLIVSASGGGVRTVFEGSAPRTTPTLFQLRAWTGPYPTWEAAQASSDANVLVSMIDRAVDGHPAPIATATPTRLLSDPPPLIPWGGSARAPILVEMASAPEPSTLALVGLGLMSLIFIWRRSYTT
jgi:hypothetical protein